MCERQQYCVCVRVSVCVCVRVVVCVCLLNRYIHDAETSTVRCVYKYVVVYGFFPVCVREFSHVCVGG